MAQMSFQTIRHPWWSSSMRGAFALLFGLFAIIWPGLTLIVLVALFGAYALLDGIVAVGVALQERRFVGHWWFLFLEGLAGIFLGVLTFIWPAMTAFALLYLIAAWAIVTGLFEVIAAFSNQIALTREWTLALAGILSILLGVLLAIQPAMGLHVLVWFVGIYAFIFGVLLIARSFQHRSVVS